MNVVIAVKGCRVLLVGFVCFGRQASFVGEFVNTRYEELRYGVRKSQKRHCETAECEYEQISSSLAIYISIEYVLQRAFSGISVRPSLENPEKDIFSSFILSLLDMRWFERAC